MDRTPSSRRASTVNALAGKQAQSEPTRGDFELNVDHPEG